MSVEFGSDLVGLLMERLSKGEIRLNSTDLGSLLREAGLSIERRRNLNRLPETMAELSRGSLEFHRVSARERCARGAVLAEGEAGIADYR